MFGQGIQPRGGFFTLSTGFSTGSVGNGRNFPLLFHSFHSVFNTWIFLPCIRAVKSYSFSDPPAPRRAGAGPSFCKQERRFRFLSKNPKVYRIPGFSGPESKRPALFNMSGQPPPFFELWKTFPLFHIPFTAPGRPFPAEGRACEPVTKIFIS